MTEKACRKCHADIVQTSTGSRGEGRELSCVAATGPSAISTERKREKRGNEMTENKTSTAKTILVTAAIAALAAVGVTALLVNIMEHKQEARNPFFRVVELTDDTDDPAVWGKNFPLQYDAYQRTVDMVRTQLRRQRGAARARRPTGRPAHGGHAVEDRGGPAPEDDVGRLRLRGRFPRGARPRLHARRPDASPSASSRQAARHLPELPRLDVRRL